MNYKEKECPKCNGERWIEIDDSGNQAICDLCKGSGVIGWIEESNSSLKNNTML